jgi:type IX secretion system PorP/SprF family membrane protein
MIKFRYIFTLLALGASMMASAQQEAGHAQNLMNALRVNPAYAGYKDVGTISLFHRSQWVGFKGAPSTQTLSFDMPLKKGKIAIGGALSNDRIGPTNTLSIQADVAYRMKLDRFSHLSFGFKASASFYQLRYDDIDLISDHYGQQDFMFDQPNMSVLLPNVGFGAFYHDNKHFLGISMPHILNQVLQPRDEALLSTLGRTEPTVHIMGGKLWKLNRKHKIQPTIMARATMNAPLSIGANLNFILFQNFKVGGYVYWNEAAGALIQYEYERRWKFGYSVDVPTNRLILNTFGNHELMVSYAIKGKRRRIVYPRYF